MTRNIFKRVWNSLFNDGSNVFNEAFLIGGGNQTDYDQEMQTYFDKGYNINPVVYSVINQQATKTASIPYYIRKIEDVQAKKKLDILNKATQSNLTARQKVKKLILENKAFSNDDLEMPLKQPNITQTWTEFHSLYKTFLKLTGNVYIYMLTPIDGMNKGMPIAIYLLPSQDMKIVLKAKANMIGIESPIDYYMLIRGKQYLHFPAGSVIHIKYANPNYSEQGEHLYGQSPLKAALKNLESSNAALGLNIKTLKSGGAFGFIHAKNSALREDQAKEIKERLMEMNNSPDDLSKIAGISAEIGFTRLSLTSDELKPFDYFKLDEKQICNVLGWSDKLLNNDDGAKYDNVNSFMRQVVTDNIVPDLLLLSKALNEYFLPRFKGYENTEIVYDVSELPEMQDDVEKMVSWAILLLDRGVLNRKEVRDLLVFEDTENPDFDVYTVSADLFTLEEALEAGFTTDNQSNGALLNEVMKYARS